MKPNRQAPSLPSTTPSKKVTTKVHDTVMPAACAIACLCLKYQKKRKFATPAGNRNVNPIKRNNEQQMACNKLISSQSQNHSTDRPTSQHASSPRDNNTQAARPKKTLEHPSQQEMRISIKNESMRETQQNKKCKKPSYTPHLAKQHQIKNAESTMVKVPEGRGEGRRPGGP